MIKNKWMIFLLFLSLFLSGCWDYKDVDEKTIAISLGIDKIKGKIQFSGENASLKSKIGEGKDKAEITNTYTFTSLGKDFEQARFAYDRQVPFADFSGAIRVVVFGENYAKDGIESYLNRINKLYGVRKTILVVISKEPPEELFKTKIENDLSVGFLIEHTVNSLKDQGQALYINIGEVLSDIALDKVGYLIPYIGKKGNTIEYLGFCIMKDSKLVGVVDAKNTEGLLYLLSDNLDFTKLITLPEDSENKFPLRTNIKKRKIQSKYINNQIVIQIHLDINASLQYQYNVKPISDEDQKKLEEILSQNIKNNIVTSIKQSQNKFQCDYFGFAKYFRGDFPKVYKKIDWAKKYPHAKINVYVKSKIINENLSDPKAKKKY